MHELPIERAARLIDPDAWRDDLPVPTRADIIAFHQRRQRSIAVAREADQALAAQQPQAITGELS